MPRFVVHSHHAVGPAGYHHDLRLKVGDVLKCWAIPKLIEPRSTARRLAIQVADHELEVLDFEGRIEEGYGKGEIIIWDKGRYEFVKDPEEGVSYKIHFFGKKLYGVWVLRQFSDKPENYLLFRGK
jgi:bifunctional non-homologous end joining protein LigD